MTELSKTVRLRIGKWYAKNLLWIEPGFNVHMEKWNPEGNECNCTITCFDEYPDSRYVKTKEELEEYTVKKFGSMIIDDLRRPRHLDLSQASENMPLSHPLVKKVKKDNPSLTTNFKDEYILEMTKEQLREANSTLPRNERLRPDAGDIKPTSSYLSDIYRLRIGKWS